MLGEDDQEPSQRDLPEARGQQPDRGRREGHRDGPDLARRAELTREEFAAQLERAAAQAAGFPVSAAVFSWTAAQLKRGEPPWWKLIAKAWEKRRFVALGEAPNVYLAALHFEALSDEDCPLVRFFPSCGGTAEADPAPGLSSFLAAPPASFVANLRDRRRSVYLQSRAALWIPPAMLYYQRRGLPYYLVQVGAGAGLDLTVDAALMPKGFDSELVAARIGLDARPLDVSDIQDRRWVTASLWPDFALGISELDGAIDAAQERQRKEAEFVQLVSCPPEKAAAFLARNVPSDDPDVGLLVFNMGVTTLMTDDEYARYGAGIAELLKPWGDRGLWMEVEGVRGEVASQTLQQKVCRWGAAAFGGQLMGTFDLTAKRHSYNPAVEAFLDVSAPK